MSERKLTQLNEHAAQPSSRTRKTHRALFGADSLQVRWTSKSEVVEHGRRHCITGGSQDLNEPMLVQRLARTMFRK